MKTTSFTCFLADIEATLELGKHLGQALAKSAVRVIFLYGSMGSGKTSLVRGLVNALPGGEHAEAASPSFSLCNWYDTTPPVIHADLFRCETGGIPEELEEAVENLAPGRPLVLVEWAEFMPATLAPAERLDIRLQTCDEGRLFFATAHGEAATRLCAGLGLQSVSA